MAHYRTMLTTEHLTAGDLWVEKSEKYGQWDVEIVDVRRGEVVGEKGRKKGMPFIRIRDGRGAVHPKPLGLNATNCEAIAMLAGSADVKRWPGTWITLYVTKTDVGKETRDCIRIRPQSPKPKNKPDGSVTRGQVEQSLKENGIIDETSNDRVDRVEHEFADDLARRKAAAERVIGRSLDDNPMLTDDEKRAIEQAEAEEARRG